MSDIRVMTREDLLDRYTAGERDFSRSELWKHY